MYWDDTMGASYRSSDYHPHLNFGRKRKNKKSVPQGTLAAAALLSTLHAPLNLLTKCIGVFHRLSDKLQGSLCFKLRPKKWSHIPVTGREVLSRSGLWCNLFIILTFPWWTSRSPGTDGMIQSFLFLLKKKLSSKSLSISSPVFCCQWQDVFLYCF